MEETSAPLWIEPTQQRSREKVGRMLDAALAMASEQGSLDLKMTEVARSADVAVGTLYQFFPSRTGLIAALFAREMAPIDASIDQLFDGRRAEGTLVKRIETLMIEQVELVRSRPGLSVIWAGASVDPVIETADLENTRKNAARLAGNMDTLLSGRADSDAVAATALLICHLWGSVIRLCVLCAEEETAILISQYAALIAARAAEFTDER
ncbi:MAG: TetR/AcrR family transcriptional regulator [Pseudomonadota bacterium]